MVYVKIFSPLEFLPKEFQGLDDEDWLVMPAEVVEKYAAAFREATRTATLKTIEHVREDLRNRFGRVKYRALNLPESIRITSSTEEEAIGWFQIWDSPESGIVFVEDGALLWWREGKENAKATVEDLRQVLDKLVPEPKEPPGFEFWSIAQRNAFGRARFDSLALVREAGEFLEIKAILDGLAP